MKKPSYIPVIILLGALVALGLSYTVEGPALQMKLGILTKVALLVGIISLWLFTLVPLMDKRQEKKN